MTDQSSQTGAPDQREPRPRRDQAPRPGSVRAAPWGSHWLRPLLWLTAAVLAAAVIGVAVYKTWPILFPPIAERAPLNPACDLAATECTVRFADGGSVALAIRPRGIPTAHPLTVAARLTGLPPPERVELDFAGLDMDMGYNRVSLAPAPDGRNRWTGTAMLPVCVRARMTWEARVLLHLPKGTLAAPFRFETARPGDTPGT